MPITERQRIVLETNAARDKAEALLRGLLDAKAVTERELSRLRREDPMRQVRGRSAIDNAISSTKRMIDTLNRSLEDAAHAIDEDCELAEALDESR
ncbi:MAG: hypothetical protein VYC34_12690 [Planctomycetota bacterium]|nr:hypothetical protein [Planctomycetota bacterium]